MTWRRRTLFRRTWGRKLWKWRTWRQRLWGRIWISETSATVEYHKNDEPDGLFDTLLNLFSVGFEPLILLLGLASLATTAVLFVAITNAGKRSFGARLVR